MSFVLSVGNKVPLANSLYREYDLCFKDFWFTWIYKMFATLIPYSSRTDFCAIFSSSFPLVESHCMHFFCYLLVCNKQEEVGLICFRIFKSIVLGFADILSFGLCLVNSECDAYLSVDHSSVYSHSKMFLLFFSVIFWHTL